MKKPLIAIISISLILLAILMSYVFVRTAPKAEKKPPPKNAPPVESLRLEAADHPVVLRLNGTVTPAMEIILQSRVSGEVVSMTPSFIEGGHIRKGEEILQIDPVDYELAIADAASKLETARFNYKLELGRQEVARREWALLKTDDASEQERELALRIPHLEASKAALQAAESALDRAELNLKRTRIDAPFNAVVVTRDIHVGSQASLQSRLGTLVGSDTYWVTTSIPVDRLKWIDIPGSPARVISNGGEVRQGRVVKQLPDLEEQGRMARILVEVSDPLCLEPAQAGMKPLLLDEYVQVEVHGETLLDTYAIPRSALRENSEIWVATEGRLRILQIPVLWKDETEIFFREGVTDGDQLITSNLTAPINGMEVQLSDSADAEQEEETTEQGSLTQGTVE